MTARSDRDLPDISVVIVVGENRPRARRAIDSVLKQDDDGRVELLVIDLARRDDAGWLEDVAGLVRRMALPESTTFGQARAAAVDAARGAVIAFLEEHCTAMPGWTRALIRAHDGPWAVVGAEVHNANPGVGWSDALYWMGYSAWMPPAERGETALAATHNSSYKADLLRRFGDRLPELLTAEPLLQEALRREGHRLTIEPEAKFQHENETSLQRSSVLYWWNRSLGRIRAEHAGWSRLTRIAYLALVPFVPWRRMARLVRYSLRSRRQLLGRLLVLLPRIWALDFMAAIGLAVGPIWGGPDDDLRFTDLELRTTDER